MTFCSEALHSEKKRHRVETLLVQRKKKNRKNKISSRTVFPITCLSDKWVAVCRGEIGKMPLIKRHRAECFKLWCLFIAIYCILEIHIYTQRGGMCRCSYVSPTLPNYDIVMDVMS